MVKFFTNPTGQFLPLKYIVVNPVTPDLHVRYIRHYIGVVREILIDTGVDYLFNLYNYVDYPRWWINNYIVFIRRVVNMVRRHGIRVYAVIPDIPSDYPGRERLYPWNVEKTLEYIEYFLDEIIPGLHDVTWIAPVQGARDNIGSVLKAYVDNMDIYKRFEYIALAPTCTTRKYRLLADLIIRFDLAVQHHYPRHKYHVFGPGLKTIQLIAGRVKRMYSFDSTGYYWHNGRRVSGGEQRTKALLDYCKKLEKLGIDTPCTETLKYYDV